MAGFGKIKGGISLPATTALNSAVYGIYTAAEAEAYRKLGLWPTAPTTPGTPTNLIGTSGNSQVSLLWSAPAANGGAAITDYSVQYSSNSGSTWSTFSRSASTATSAVVTSLTNDTSYVFRVAAVNALGTGAFSTASAAVTPTASDALFASVALLLPFDGTGNTFVDSSPTPKTITAIGNATQSATESKWGGKSLALDGTNANLSLPSSALAFNGDFVIEGWIYLISNSLYSPIIDTRVSPSFADFVAGVYSINGGHRLDFVTGGGVRLTASSTSVALGSWSHFAFVRSGGVISGYVNGVRDATQLSYATSISPASATALIGRNVDGNFINGYIDDLRVTIGSARGYTGATIAVPTAAFSNYASLIAPAAPATLSGIPGDTSVTLSWPLPGVNGGPAITDYTVQYSSDSGSNWTTFSDGTSASRTTTVTGLTNGVAHLFRVAATNSVGTGSYVTSDAITPAIISALTIVTQPKNDYTTLGSQNITFSVVATGGGGEPTYQWQYFGAAESIGEYDSIWRNISGATASSYTTNSNTMASYELASYYFYYGGGVNLRCVITPASGATALTSDVVRFLPVDTLLFLYLSFEGSQGSYPNYGEPWTFSPAPGENLIINVSDYGMASPDVSWYTGNDKIIKLQVATTGHTDSADWTDLSTIETRRYVYLPGNVITPSTGIKYYRAIAVHKWPYAVNNGTQSATHATTYIWPNYAYNAIQVTWPAVT